MNSLLNYFPSLSTVQLEQFKLLQEVFLDWNTKVNLISRKDTDHLTEKHILHSLGIAKLATFDDGSKVLDIGTGGGFPGIPLAIFFPNVQFHLVDSIGKKIMVVQDIVKQLGLTNVIASQVRAEELEGDYDFVVSRAVTRLEKFIPWIKGKLTNTSVNDFAGLLYLKGGDILEEVSEVEPIKSTIYELKKIFKEDFFETKKIVHISSKELS